MAKKKMFLDLFGTEEELDEQEAAERKELQEKAEESATVSLERATPEPERGDTVLAAGTSFEGTLDSSGNVDVFGSFTGDIRAQGRVVLRSAMTGNVSAETLELLSCTLTGELHVSGRLTVSEGSSVTGDVYAMEADISGKIEGNLYVEKQTNLKATAEIKGDIKTGSMTMAAGAKVGGNVEMMSV